VLFLVLVSAPAAIRWIELEEAPAQARELLDATQAALRAAELSDSVRRLRAALDRQTGLVTDEESWVRERGRFRAYPVDVLPFGDPSSVRRGFWVAALRIDDGAAAWTDSGLTRAVSSPGIELEEGAAVVFGAFVIGRLETLIDGAPAGRVQTLRDPGFRVKFRCGDVVGVLRGGAGVGNEELPLLEAHHLTPLVDLPGGAEVLTAGGDGVFPPGFLVGHVVARDDQTSGSAPIVRAAIDPDSIVEAVVLVDLLKGRLRGAGYGG